MLTDKQNAMIGLLLSSFPAFQTGDAESTLTAYELALEGFADSDVGEGVTAFIQGRVPGHNMAFAPTAPQLASACRRAMEARLDVVNRNRALQRQIEARKEVEKSPESRARVKAKVDALIARLSENSLTEDAREARYRAELARRVNERFEPDQSSGPMLRRLGFEVGDRDGDEDAA